LGILERIILKWTSNKLAEGGLDLSDSGWISLTASCVHRNDPSYAIEIGEFLEHLRV
jgi:hypothetical protein